jgi:hypothetical protein
MTIAALLAAARKIWGAERMTLPEIIVCLNVILGDIARLQRDRDRERSLPGVWDRALKKELGNLILSTIRWCDDLDFNPNECIIEAQKAQAVMADRLRIERTGRIQG